MEGWGREWLGMEGWGREWLEMEGWMDGWMEDRELTKAELGIRVCSSSCKYMTHQIPATPHSHLVQG